MIDEIRGYFAARGCVLKSKVFEGVHKRLEYQCSCGRPGSTSWANFKKSPRCRACGLESRASKRRSAVNEVEARLQQIGFELLGEYKNNVTPVLLRCPQGHESAVRIGNLLSGQGCKQCGVQSRSGDAHYRWIKDRTEASMKKCIHQRCAMMLRTTLVATGQKKNTTTKKILGYGPEELRRHLEQHPDWSSVSQGDWHIDHIYPVKAFVEHGVKDLAIINCLENLRPLSAKENLSKGGGYDAVKFREWLSHLGSFDINSSQVS